MRPVRIVADALELEESHNGRLSRADFLPDPEPELPEAEDEQDHICDDHWPRMYASEMPFRKRRSGYDL